MKKLNSYKKEVISIAIHNLVKTTREEIEFEIGKTMEEIDNRRFVCVWMEPTYNPDTNEEALETIMDENRGFTDENINLIVKMKPKDILQLEDLVIVRTK